MLKIFYALGTVCQIYVPGRFDEDTMRKVTGRILELHNRVNFYSPDSELSAVNRNAGVRMQEVSEDTWRLFRMSRKAYRETEGAFDCTAGPSAEIWKRAIRDNRLPDPDKIAGAMPCSGGSGIREVRKTEPDGIHYYAGLEKEGQQADFGGIAKGYAVDLAAEMLKKQGVSNALVNFGGSVRVIGNTRRVGVRNPFHTTGPSIGVLNIPDGVSVVTSGIYEQCRKIRGRLVHHIIDSRTGEPAGSGLAAATLIGKNTAVLDVLATACISRSLADMLPEIRRRGIEGIFISRQGEVAATFDFHLIRSAAG